MAEEKGLVNKSTMAGIADAIRAQAETDETMQPSEMPEKIRALNVLNGIVPIDKGGTGAANATDARSNLGITPDNIGALPKIGGDMAGWIDFGGETQGLKWTTADGTQFRVRPYAAGNIFQITRTPPGGTEQNALMIDKDGNVGLGGIPLNIDNGGTGAANAADARSNLGITPDNIGALPKTGGDMTGFVEFRNGVYGGLRWYCENGAKIDLRAIGPANMLQITVTPSGGTEFGAFNIDTDGNISFTNPLPVTSGGTGAREAYQAAYNLFARGDATGDLNNYQQPGCFLVRDGAEVANAPDSWGVLTVSCGEQSYIYQQFRSLLSGRLYERTRGDNGSWSNWGLIYNHNTIVFSSTDPGCVEGKIWLKPIS